ncbi:hypothetical protein K439DRAFT_1624140 [Ramaria rubella]|nr:hypothetical protein K439DRAFT_1624140 [Ramaria rubella]
MKKPLDANTLMEMITNIRKRFPKMGARDMRYHIHTEYNIWVPCDTLLTWFRIHEPALIHERQAKHFKRKRFYAAGVNHIWAIDQHNKWKRFRVWFHLGVEPYSGKLLWLKVWWTNSNPHLISIPLLSQSDPGPENYGVANSHTGICHYYDLSLVGTSQHKWKRKHQNVKPEIEWAMLRHRWTPGFEDKLDHTLNHNIYNPDDELKVLVFHWVAIPYFQKELDVYREIRNNSNRRHDRHKVLSKGIPDLIFNKPHKYNASLDFKHVVNAEVQLLHQLWNQIGSPTITTVTLWNVFAQLVDLFHGVAPDPHLTVTLQTAPRSGDNGGTRDAIALQADLSPANIHHGTPNGMPFILEDMVGDSSHYRSTIRDEVESGEAVTDEFEEEEEECIFVSFTDEEGAEDKGIIRLVIDK